jgi:Tat protein translocase TatC
MSFLDHLEELRIRIFKAIAAIMVGVIAGWFLVERLHLVAVLKAPIAPYLPAGKLVVLSPTEPLMIVLKLAVILGCILASPVVIWQVWGFLSPALYVRERKIVVPALTVGVGLFLLGAVLAFVFVVPQVLTVLFSFQTDSLATMITFEKYFDFVVQLMVAMGISFELPLVIMILASFGLVTPAALARFRRVAIILSMVAGAVLSPGTDVFSMLMLCVPMILLYEVGYVGSIIIWRRKLRSAPAAAVVLLCLALGGAGRLEAQVPPTRPPTGLPTGRPRLPRAPGDTLGIQRGAPVDTAAARRLGLPTGPSREFPASDSVLDALLRRDGYESTRFQADSATLYVPERRIDLEGRAMTDRAGSILEARRIGYAETSCILDARGDPRVFDQGTVLVGEGLRYNTCEKRAVVSEALTNFQENGVGWFMRGDLAQDSTARRIYASSADITSCDLPVPHYHFAARQAKWISKSVLVARPAVLYVRDVPLLWLPFIFQDGRPGRRSGILVPKFGINDIVRPSKNYARQVTNVGYYWAPNEYFDALAKFDWYASRYYRWETGVQYHWLDRFVGGSFLFNRTVDDNGTSALGVIWQHRQSFSLTSTLNMDVNYTSNTSIDRRNSTNPSTVVQQVTSRASYMKRFAWGTFNVGANRSQSLTNGSITEAIPTVSFSPNPIDLTSNITWSPGFSFSQNRSLHAPGSPVLLLNPNDTVDINLPRTVNSRNTTFSLATPFRIGGFNWSNTVGVTDARTDQRRSDTYRAPNGATPDPNDSVSVTRITEGDFSTGIDWTTGISLPILLRGSWKVTPAFRVSNVASGPFLIRNRLTGGQFVAQSKRPEFGITSTPAFFAFLPGFGPIARIRHSFTPTLSFSYVPEASIPEGYARAFAAPGQVVKLTAPASQTASFGFSQSFEAKAQRGPADTGAISTARKYKLLSISTSSISYDFERAKQLHQTGWTTQTLSNSFESDLVPGFNVALTHDLWRGPVGTDSARFEPFLTGVSAGFGVSGNTFRSLGHLLGLGRDTASTGGTTHDPLADPSVSVHDRPGSFSIDRSLDRKGHTPFQARVTYSLTRLRPDSVARRAQASLGLNTSFAPTAFWSVTWSTQYNIAQGRFESQLITLERDLHEWRASFNFQRSPNGNFAFVFNIFLLDLPAVKFDYNQTTLTP